MKIKLKLHTPQPGDKRLVITEKPGNFPVEAGLQILVNYDDVDHDRVLKVARAIVRKVNSA